MTLRVAPNLLYEPADLGVLRFCLRLGFRGLGAGCSRLALALAAFHPLFVVGGEHDDRATLLDEELQESILDHLVDDRLRIHTVVLPELCVETGVNGVDSLVSWLPKLQDHSSHELLVRQLLFLAHAWAPLVAQSDVRTVAVLDHSVCSADVKVGDPTNVYNTTL